MQVHEPVANEVLPPHYDDGSTHTSNRAPSDTQCSSVPAPRAPVPPLPSETIGMTPLDPPRDPPHETRPPLTAKQAAIAIQTSLQTTGSVPLGMGALLIQAKDTFCVRLWLIDNSGSMQTVHTGTCDTRWESVRSGLCRHAELLHSAGMLTRIVFLHPPRNGAPDSITLGQGDVAASRQGLAAFKAGLQAVPGGVGNICNAIDQLGGAVSQLAGRSARGEHPCNPRMCIAVRIVTDDVTCDGDLRDALRNLQQHATVWPVVQLCGRIDDVEHCAEWHDLNARVDIDLDVVWQGSEEARRMRASNAWLCYCDTLHCLRLVGSPERRLALIGKGQLCPTDALMLASLILGRADSIGRHIEIGAYDKAHSELAEAATGSPSTTCLSSGVVQPPVCARSLAVVHGHNTRYGAAACRCSLS